MGGTLAELDRRIVGALQVDGRADWPRIAAALGEPDGVVERHGSELLAAGAVRVTGAAAPSAGAIVALRCEPGKERIGALALANRRDTRNAHVLAGPYGCLAEIDCDPARLAAFTLDELPLLPALTGSGVWTVLRYVRTSAQWRPGLLTDAEYDALVDVEPPPEYAPFGEAKDVNRPDALLLAALAHDGRRDVDELAGVTGLSASAVRRRVERLRREGGLRLRVVVDPALLGFTVRAVVSVRCAPRDTAAVATALSREPSVRHAACVTGDRQIVAEVAVSTVDALHDLLTSAAWLDRVVEAEASPVVGTLKRDGLFTLPSEH
ncbi:MAG: Lrp/AsnC family transcriptional regulator [Pseudonocardiaceae bacterium]|nr:MAG: Lrp/AsnC family transcriptional regulator [Pseudonocardiaceae bacterium]